MKKAKIIQQGDILFIPIDKIPKKAKRVASKKYHILARGEVTGHSHRVAVNEARVYKFKDLMFLALMGEVARVLHEEHKTQILTYPYYQVVRIKEYDYDEEQTKNIRD